MRGKKKHVFSLLAIFLAVILLTGAASFQDKSEEPAQDISFHLDPKDDLEWAHRPAIDPEVYHYYSTISIDEQPTTAELEG